MVEGQTKGKTFAEESEERKKNKEAHKLSQEEQELVNAASYLVPIYEQMKEKDLIDGDININTIILTATRIGIDSMVNHAIQQGFMEDPRVEAASQAGYLQELERKNAEDAAKEEVEAEIEAEAAEDLDAVQEAHEGSREGMLAKEEEAPEPIPALPEPSEAMQDGLFCQDVDNAAK